MKANASPPYPKLKYTLLALSLCLLLAGQALAGSGWPKIASSADGTPVSYETHGSADAQSPALVFVHGWNCDSRYWREQVPHFSRTHRVITLDLAGHGHSGQGRADHTMRSYGEDVRAVVEAAGADRVILIGHSMGGSVIAEAARLMPERTVALIGVDTLENVSLTMTEAQKEEMIAPFRKDFAGTTRGFVRSMLRQDTGPDLGQWIADDMAAAPPASAVSAMENMVDQYVTGEAARIFSQINAPVFAVNADVWPVNHEGNRQYMHSFESIVLKDADHFLMLNRPEEFNRALEEVLKLAMRADR